MAAEIAGAIFALWILAIRIKPEWFCPYCRSTHLKITKQDESLDR